MKIRPLCTFVFCLVGAIALHAAPQQWRVAEFPFSAQETYAEIPSGVRFGARFTGPDGSTYEVPGFWDGGQTWRLRFTPTMPGAWSYETTAIEVASDIHEELYAGDLMRGGQEAQRVDIPLGRGGRLVLAVGGDDGTDYDHADWGDAHFVKQDGSIVYLDDLQPSAATQGHGKLGIRTNIPGHPLKIGTRTFKRGLGTHAASRIIYQLDGTEARFRAWVGVDATVREHGSVRFEVLLSRRTTEHVGRRDGGLHGKRGSFTALPASGETAFQRHGGILRVGKDGHQLTHTDGTPFFWLGDTWWFCPSDLVPIDGSTNPDIPSAFRDIVAIRKRQGFTTVHMAFLGTIDGINPYHDRGRGPSLNPAYWQKVDRYMDHANANGLLPVIGMGWAGRPLSLADWQQVWRHLIARYGGHAVTWLVCGEYNVRGTDEIVDQTMELAAFIKQTDPYHRAMTIHPWAQGAEKRQAWDKPWYDFIMIQGGHGGAPAANLYLDAYKRTPAKPVLEAECQYEGIHSFTDSHVRNVAYRAIQSGSFGFTYGSQGLWYPTQNEQDKMHEKWGKPLVWWKAARRPGAEQMGHLRRIYETVDWWKLQPKPDAVGMVTVGDAKSVVYDLIASFPKAKVQNAHWSKLNEADSNCIELHPQGQGEAILTYPAIALPVVEGDERLVMALAIGMSQRCRLDDAKHPSDGVRFSVKVDGKELFSQHRHAKPWVYQAIDLTPHAGKKVTLSLATAAGKNMNWDHALFRHPVVLKTTEANPCRDAYLLPPPRPVLTKADGNRTFVLYYPANPGPGQRQLHGLEPTAAYTLAWHDPRTGKALPPKVTRPKAASITLPEPPDAQDWVLIVRQQ